MGNKIKICFINGTNPIFLGGIGIYQKNLLKELPKNYEVTWIYRGNHNKKYKKEGINFVAIKDFGLPLQKEFIFNKKVKSFLDKDYFDIINSHAVWGYWMKKYKRKERQKLVHTYHGVTHAFYKTHERRFLGYKKIILQCLLWFSKKIEHPPMQEADKIICVSEKVKKQLENLYGGRKGLEVLRTGVDLKNFKKRNKKASRRKIGLKEKNIYALYIGKGGYWTKGLDYAVKLSKEIYKKNKNFRLIVIGAEKETKGKPGLNFLRKIAVGKNQKMAELLDNNFIIYKKEVDRKKMPFYYSSSDFLFAFSRYEGGAPTLVVSEAMASGCIVLSSDTANQEIIENGKNGLIINNFGEKEAKQILDLEKNKKLKEKIIKNSILSIKKISLKNWQEEYLKILRD